MPREKDSKQSIKVAIRIRPILEKQFNDETRTCIKVEQSRFLNLISGNQIKKFAFDTICFNQSQQQIFEKFGKKCAKDSLEGYNCTIFAYGQTGAGKTYTMMGRSFEDENYHEHRGLIPRTMEFLFNCIKSQHEKGVNFIIRCSYLQIYNEQIIDLLNKSNNNLQLREDAKKGVYVEGITQQTVTKSQQALNLLQKGSKSRHVSSTLYNEFSSRSHSVFTLQIQQKFVKNGVCNIKSRQFNFIDLAGSERTKLSTGERLREGCNINKSLMNLSSVINALSEASQGRMQHINYRSSKLTFLLKDSLGGNSKTNLIANIHPATVFYQQTLSTLGFARRAKLVKRQKALINQDSTGSLQSMKNQIKRLNQEIINFMNGSQQSSLDKHFQQKPNQMSSFIAEFVEEQIDKQSRFQMQILKLKDRITHLQNGIKLYSNNQIHLRMIVSIYQDKIQRLKKTEQHLKQKIFGLDEADQDSKITIEYFKNERNSLVKLLQNCQFQAESNKYLKELLKQTKILRQQDDQGLKQLLTKNNNYLTAINSKLSDVRQETTEPDCQSSIKQRIDLIVSQNSKREEQLQERLDQANLELSEFKNKSDQNEKILEEMMNTQIKLEDKIALEASLKQSIQKSLEKVQLDFISYKQTSIAKLEQLSSQNGKKDIQLNELKEQIQILKSQLSETNHRQLSLKSQFQAQMKQKQQLQSKYDQLLKEFQSINQIGKQRQNQLKAKQDKIISLTAHLNQKDSKFDQMKRQFELLKTEYSKICLIKDEIELKLQNIQNTFQLEQAKNADFLIQKNKNSTLMDALMAQKQKIESEYSIMIQTIANNRSEIACLTQDLSTSKAQLQSLLDQRQRINITASKYIETINDLNEKLEQVSFKLGKQIQQKQQIQQKLLSMVNDLNHSRLEYEQLSKKNKSYEIDIKQMKRQACDYLVKVEHLQQVNKQLHESLNSKNIQNNSKISELFTIIQKQKQLSVNLRDQIKDYEHQIKTLNREINDKKSFSGQLECKLRQMDEQAAKISEEYQKLNSLIFSYKEENILIKEQLSKKDAELIQLNQSLKKQQKDHQNAENIQTHIQRLIKDNKKMQNQLSNNSKSMKELSIENNALKEKLHKHEIYHQKASMQLQELHSYKQRWQLQVNEMEKIQNQIEEEITSKEKILKELLKEKEDNLNMKQLLQKISTQNTILQSEIQQKETMNQKLIDKCAINEKQNRKSASSEHYLRTIELLDKSRSQQIQLRRQNDDLKRTVLSLKQAIAQKQAHARQIQQKSSAYCENLHQKIQKLEKQYTQLDKKYERLIKQKRNYEKFTRDNELLKDQIRSLKQNGCKIAQKNEQMQGKIKKANLNSIKLQKQYEEIKKSDSFHTSSDEKNSYVHRLKAEIASLKTERILLTESLNKERDEISALKSQLRKGNTDGALKHELQKKFNENKNLTELIFQIISQLKLCVHEPKAKLEAIRNLILGGIRQKFDEIKLLKDKIRYIEKNNSYHDQISDYVHCRQNRQLKAINIQSNRRYLTEQNTYKYDKSKESSSYLKSFSSQNMRQYEKFNAKLKYNQNQIKKRMFD